MARPQLSSRLSWKGLLARVAFVLGLLAAFAPRRCWAQDVGPKLLSTGGGAGLQTWKNLAALQKAAAGGNPEACMQLGLCYETGDEVRQDYVQARTLYEQAAAGGVADAIYRLGKLHQDGLGLESDPIHARELYRIAALAGVPLAQYNLGAMLVSARGGKRDLVEGLAWLILARRNQVEADGEEQVRERLAAQPNMIAAAEKRSEELSQAVAARKGAKPTWPPPDSEPVLSLPVAPAPPVVKHALPPPKLAPPEIAPLPPPVFSPPAIPGVTKP